MQRAVDEIITLMTKVCRRERVNEVTCAESARSERTTRLQNKLAMNMKQQGMQRSSGVHDPP